MSLNPMCTKQFEALKIPHLNTNKEFGLNLVRFHFFWNACSTTVGYAQILAWRIHCFKADKVVRANVDTQAAGKSFCSL